MNLRKYACSCSPSPPTSRSYVSLMTGSVVIHFILVAKRREDNWKTWFLGNWKRYRQGYNFHNLLLLRSQNTGIQELSNCREQYRISHSRSVSSRARWLLWDSPAWGVVLSLFCSVLASSLGTRAAISKIPTPISDQNKTYSLKTPKHASSLIPAAVVSWEQAPAASKSSSWRKVQQLFPQ